MKIDLTAENQSALNRVCELLGVSRTNYLDHLVGSFVRHNLETRELDFLSEEVASEIYDSMADAEGVADRFNELVVDRQLSGEFAQQLAGKEPPLYTAEAVKTKRGFQVRVDWCLPRDNWKVMPQLGE